MFLAKEATGASAAIALAMVLGVASPAFAGPDSWRDLLFGDAHRDERRQPAPPVARYVSGEGEHFVLDRSGSTVLMKFEDSPEVYALQASQAPRGDIIYRNDLGEPVLRATRLGGMTLFYRARSGGTPVALDGAAQSLRLQYLPPALLLQKLAQASLRASRAAQHLVEFDAPDVIPGAQAVYADAAGVAAEAVVRMSKGAGGRAAIARLKRIVLVNGRKGSATMKGAEIRVVINAKEGLAGRPSSDNIILAAARR